jgi:hypothetical protein
MSRKRVIVTNQTLRECPFCHRETRRRSRTCPLCGVMNSPSCDYLMRRRKRMPRREEGRSGR